MDRDEKPKTYPPDEGGLALKNGWDPERETLEQWRERRRAVWRAERDRVLRTGDY
jgi:hypothetical protein